MKYIKLLTLGTIFTLTAMVTNAQKETATFEVSGNCGMCKTKIEKAAKESGATDAEWNRETKQLTVKYKGSKTSVDKIQKEIAAVGYDNAGARATDETYSKLHGCCKYERKATTPAKLGPNATTKKDGASCCSKEGSEGAGCSDKKAEGAKKDGASCCSKDAKDKKH